MALTPKGLWYPDGSGVPSRDQLKQMMDGVDGKIPAWMSLQTINVPVSASSTGSATNTFPVGRFTVTPFIFVQSTDNRFHAVTSTGSTINCSVVVRNVDGVTSTATVSVRVLALQMMSGQSQG